MSDYDDFEYTTGGGYGGNRPSIPQDGDNTSVMLIKPNKQKGVIRPMTFGLECISNST